MKYVLAVFLFLISTSQAFAYLDPGSGGILFQILAAIGIFFALMWRKLKRLFTGKKGEQEEVDKAVQDLLTENEAEQTEQKD